MECLQGDGVREINHHGNPRTIDEGGNKLFKKSNKLTGEDGDPAEIAQMKMFKTKQSISIDYLKLSQFAAKTGIPIVITAFSTLYWSYGLFYYFNPALWIKSEKNSKFNLINSVLWNQFARV